MEKLDSGTVELQLAEVRIDELIESSIESVRDYAEEKKVRIEYDGKRPVNATVDSDRIEQVLANLLSNAVKFSFEEGKVAISCSSDERAVEITVTDEGRGIPVELQAEVFQAYKQAKSSDATELDGTGLGLAICKRLIEKHGGTIGVRSQPGQGSTFWLKLPLKQEVS
jgi:signal transduction histidine kinase